MKRTEAIERMTGLEKMLTGFLHRVKCANCAHYRPRRESGCVMDPIFGATPESKCEEFLFRSPAERSVADGLWDEWAELYMILNPPDGSGDALTGEEESWESNL